MSDNQNVLTKIAGLDSWLLDPNFTNERFVEISIHLKHIDISLIREFEPGDRKRIKSEDQRDKFEKLVQTNLFDKYKVIGTLKVPGGIKTRVALSILNDIKSLNFVDHIFIHHMDGARKKTQRKQSVFYCVKMTVAIEIEGVENGLQHIEDRFVMIKANSFDDAYQKVEQKKDEYAEPYLNSDGRMVRWRIESFDDCYQTDVKNMKDLNNPAGTEVYSKLRSRRLTKQRIWDGK